MVLPWEASTINHTRNLYGQSTYAWKSFSIFIKTIFIKTLNLFTMKKVNNGKLVFLDTLLKRNNGKIFVLLYRKPTDTDPYLHYSSQHQISCKEGNCSVEHSPLLPFHLNDLTKESASIKQVLKRNGCQVINVIIISKISRKTESVSVTTISRSLRYLRI